MCQLCTKRSAENDDESHSGPTLTSGRARGGSQTFLRSLVLSERKGGVLEALGEAGVASSLVHSWRAPREQTSLKWSERLADMGSGQDNHLSRGSKAGNCRLCCSQGQGQTEGAREADGWLAF